MRTTIDLPDNLVNEAMKMTRIKTKTKVIITALEQLIRRESKLSETKRIQRKNRPMDIDLETIRLEDVNVDISRYFNMDRLF